jgi:hypothetical protein
MSLRVLTSRFLINHCLTAQEPPFIYGYNKREGP